MFVYVYVSIHICICICAYIYIYIYTTSDDVVFVEFIEFHIYINDFPMTFAKFSHTETYFFSSEHLFCSRDHSK